MDPGLIDPGQTDRVLLLTTEKRAEILAALNENPNANQVARQVGAAVSTVWTIARNAGIELTAGKAASKHLPPEKRAEIIAALNVNPNATQVAKQIGSVSVTTVWNIAHTEGIKLTRAQGPRRAANHNVL
jgi:IS30 family transposase